LRDGQDLIVISMGPVLEQLQALIDTIKEETGHDIGLINARFIKPMDEKMLTDIASLQVPVLVYEESTLIGGLGTGIMEYYNEQQLSVDVKRMGIKDVYVQHGEVSQVLEELQLSVSDIKNEILNLLEK
ncbi:MAG TPA: 1-deoxy-D-xylulose-5-phosphate synthase, partial [Firmicutes bacterium]|nr:1-deoxy-D-xylulose-5-phosphate synthase [Bacillota bacterium]